MLTLMLMPFRFILFIFMFLCSYHLLSQYRTIYSRLMFEYSLTMCILIYVYFSHPTYLFYIVFIPTVSSLCHVSLIVLQTCPLHNISLLRCDTTVENW